MNLYIKAGSVTNAQRGQKLLRSKGFKPQIKKIENPSRSDGCGYAIEVEGNKNEIIKILEESKIEIRGVEVL